MKNLKYSICFSLICSLLILASCGLEDELDSIGETCVKCTRSTGTSTYCNSPITYTVEELNEMVADDPECEFDND
tara:strand:+ start:704 stop:928 length:225 start_codon:yes stop_codon:yes gene_type:complete